MAWYRTGTISLTNGSTTVTGSGTTWIANAGIGEALYAPDGRLYEIANIASDTSITLGSAYLGTTASAQPYVLVPSQSYIRDLASQAADLVNNYSTIYNTVGQGKFADGTLANPAIRFSDDLDTGFFRSATNEVTFVAGGVAQFKYNTSGLQFTGAGSLVNLTTTGNTTLGDAVADTVTINGTPTINAPTVITTNSSTNALRITQTGTGNALLVEDSANPDATPFVINNVGQVLVGVTSSAPAIETIAPLLTTSSAEGANQDIGIYNFRNAGGSGRTTISPRLFFARSRSAVNGTVGGIVINNEDLGQIRFAGDDGTQFLTAAEIGAEVDGTPGTNDMPGRLVFSTTADGASTPTERMRIDNQGKLSMGGVAGVGQSVLLNKNITGSVNSYGVLSQPQIQSDVTSNAYTFYAGTNTASASFTLGNAIGYAANQAVVGAGSTVTNQIGFDAGSSLTGATNNFGFRSNIASGTGRWNFYAAGTADNYFAGNTGIGTATVNPIGTSTNLAMYGSASTSISFRAGAGTGGYISTDGVNYFQFMGLAATSATVLGSNNTTRLSISSTGTISLGSTAGSESLRVTPVASAVNYLQVTGGTTGGNPILSAQGSDANVNMEIRSKGTGVLALYTNSTNLQLLVAHTASTVNYAQVRGGVTGGGVAFSAQGSDTNIDLILTPKGTGNVRFGTLTANADAPITGYIEIKDSAGNIRKLAVIA